MMDARNGTVDWTEGQSQKRTDRRLGVDTIGVVGCRGLEKRQHGR